MRKFFLTIAALLVVLALVPTILIANGTISRSSLPMILNVMAGTGGDNADAHTVKKGFQVPAGFQVQLYASDLPGARFMRPTAAGDLLLSRPHRGDILLLRADRNNDGQPDAIETLLDGLKRPLGLDVDDDFLYIAESHQVIRVRFDSDTGTLLGAPEVIVAGLTDNGNHWSKTLRIGPDDKLYLAQGSTCNVCEEDDARRATMMRLNRDGTEGSIIATGLRNSVGFDWSPLDGGLYATDNGRDMLGDDFPPCELNRIVEGQFYGWPYYNGDNIPDPDMGSDPLAKERAPKPPVFGFRAHNAPLGIHFLRGDTLPKDYAGSALVALHGSWNRSSPDGYKVISLHWGANGVEARDFLTGLLEDDRVIGRPVGVTQGIDGAIYVSDDYANAIYKITYGNVATAHPASSVLPSHTQRDDTPPDWLADADISTMTTAGEALYHRFGCANCHERGRNPKRLDDLHQRLGYRATLKALQEPQPPMPVYPLSEQQARELAVFLLHRRS